MNQNPENAKEKFIPLVFDDLAAKGYFSSNYPVKTTAALSTEIWSLEDNLNTFYNSMKKLIEKSAKSVLEFDKDDSLVMDLVLSATNIRASIFRVPLESFLKIQKIVGNIEPAIATTNAIISGFIVLNAIKIVTGHFGECKTMICLSEPSGKVVTAVGSLQAPSPKCQVCTYNQMRLTINTKTQTMKDLVAILKREITVLDFYLISMFPRDGLDDKPVVLFNGMNVEVLEKTLSSLDIAQNTILYLDDDNFGAMISVIHTDINDPSSFSLIGDKNTRTALDLFQTPSKHDSDDEIEVLPQKPIDLD